jgi:hypothetical protein
MQLGGAEGRVVSGTAAPPRRPSSSPYLPGQLPPPDPPPDAPRRPSVWRIVVGCLLVIALSAATTVVFIKDEIGTLARDLSFNKAINVPLRSLAPVGFGDPQTILLIGNAVAPGSRSRRHRPRTGGGRRTRWRSAH